jgi:Family of unknown function (DUF6629)
MCFSAEADVVIGLAVGAVGIDAVRHVTDRRELPLATLPLLFAAHQLIEAFVWWGLDGTVSASLGTVAANLYLVIAFVLPVVVPLTVVAVEPDRVRRRIMVACAALGAVISAVLLASLARGDLFTEEAGLHVSYSVGLTHGGVFSALYVLCVCGAFLASSSRRIVLFGAVNLVAVTTLAWLTMDGVISLWCAWAAVTSVLIDAHLRTSHRGDLDPVGTPVPA